MIYSKQSTHSPDEIATRLAAAAARHKFGILHVHDLRQTLESKGLQLGSDCRVYDICNPQAALTALHTDMRVSAILPCRISVFSQDGGCLIATVVPTSLFEATGLAGAETLAADVQRELIAIIDETA